jgi:glycosyltransferase involved in cell wall biosynthesis
MNILLLCEGDAGSWSAWSGITKSLVDHLRLDGHSVETADVDLYAFDRYVAAAATFAPHRHRWGTRYHLGPVPFRLKSRRAVRHVAACSAPVDVILQIGATFNAATARVPYCLCCDSNIRVAQAGASSGFSDAVPLSASELAAIERRERAVYQGAAGIFPLSERLGRSFVDDFGVRPERVKPIYAGPNFQGDQMLGARRPRPVNAPPTVLFVGLQFHRKGGDVLVESFRRVREQLPTARLVLAGVARGFIREPGVECLGELDKNQAAGAAALAAAYASADVFALPTRFEPFGIAFVEAMHFGLPCIGPAAWAVPEIIADGETGFLVPVNDATTLADRLLRLLRNPNLARQMGTAARERAQRLFTWPAVVRRMTDLLATIVEGRARTQVAVRTVA